LIWLDLPVGSQPILATADRGKRRVDDTKERQAPPTPPAKWQKDSKNTAEGGRGLIDIKRKGREKDFWRAANPYPSYPFTLAKLMQIHLFVQVFIYYIIIIELHSREMGQNNDEMEF
jgi:hypothetical protein